MVGLEKISLKPFQPFGLKLLTLAGYKVCNTSGMRKFLVFPVFFLLNACAETEQVKPSPGVLQNTQQSNTSDSSGLVSDSVVIKDSNTADVEPLKKIN